MQYYTGLPREFKADSHRQQAYLVNFKGYSA